MKRLAVLLTAVVIIGTSQASTSLNGNVLFGKPTVTVTQPKTATRKEAVLVKSPRIPKPKLFRANPHRLSYYAFINDQDDIGIDDDDLAPSYRRRDFSKVYTDPTPDDPEGIITEDIRWKLFLARQLALLKYREIHS